MTELYKHFGDFSVYPGHPVTVALEIMLAYEGNIEEAMKPSLCPGTGKPFGWSAAVGDCRISGGGGCVWQGLNLLTKVHSGELSPEDAIKWGVDMWKQRTLVGGDHRDKYEEGVAQAQKYAPVLLDIIKKSWY